MTDARMHEQNGGSVQPYVQPSREAHLLEVMRGALHHLRDTRSGFIAKAVELLEAEVGTGGVLPPTAGVSAPPAPGLVPNPAHRPGEEGTYACTCLQYPHASWCGPWMRRLDGVAPGKLGALRGVLQSDQVLPRDDPSGETMAQREEVCAAWHALPDELRKDTRLTRLYRALGGPRMDDPTEAAFGVPEVPRG